MLERVAGTSAVGISLAGFIVAQVVGVDPSLHDWANLGGMAMFGLGMFWLLRERNKQAAEDQRYLVKTFQAEQAADRTLWRTSLEKIWAHHERQLELDRNERRRQHQEMLAAVRHGGG